MPFFFLSFSFYTRGFFSSIWKKNPSRYQKPGLELIKEKDTQPNQKFEGKAKGSCVSADDNKVKLNVIWTP